MYCGQEISNVAKFHYHYTFTTPHYFEDGRYLKARSRFNALRIISCLSTQVYRSCLLRRGEGWAQLQSLEGHPLSDD